MEKKAIYVGKQRKATKRGSAEGRLLRVLTVVICCIVLFLGVRMVTGMYDMAVAAFGSSDGINLSKEMRTGGIPRLYQWDERWAEKSYGTSEMKTSGCGPTCLSMVCCGLTGEANWNPYQVARMAERNGYYVPGSGSSWKLMTEGAEKMGLKAEEVIFDEAHIRQELEEGHPIICAVGSGDFTTEGHFIVLTEMTEDGGIRVNDPNSETLSEKTWELERIMSQVKNLWSYRVK